MIRFVDLGYQIDEDFKYFSFFSTTHNAFIRIGADVVFESIEDLKEAINLATNTKGKKLVDPVMEARLLSLVPEEYFKENRA